MVLLDLGHLGVVQVDVERHHLDAFGNRFVDRVLECFGQPQLHDDPVDAEVDGLFDHLPLAGGLLPGVEYPQVGAEGGGLLLHALQICLGEVPGKQITDQGDLHRAFVERRRGTRQRCRLGLAGEAGEQRRGQAVSNSVFEESVHTGSLRVDEVRGQRVRWARPKVNIRASTRTNPLTKSCA